MPSYIQLDHVYGLAGFDLNMSKTPPVAHANSRAMCRLGLSIAVQLAERSTEERGLDANAIAMVSSSCDAQVKSEVTVKTPWIFA